MDKPHRFSITTDDAHKRLTWLLEQIANFMDDHDVFLPRLSVEYRGLKLTLSVERLPP